MNIELKIGPISIEPEFVINLGTRNLLANVPLISRQAYPKPFLIISRSRCEHCVENDFEIIEVFKKVKRIFFQF